MCAVLAIGYSGRWAAAVPANTTTPSATVLAPLLLMLSFILKSRCLLPVCPGPVVGDPGWFCPPLLHHLPFAACFTKPTKSRSALGFGSILIYLFIHCCFTIIITWCMMKLLYSTRKRLCVTFFHLVFKNDVLKIGQFGWMYEGQRGRVGAQESWRLASETSKEFYFSGEEELELVQEAERYQPHLHAPLEPNIWRGAGCWGQGGQEYTSAFTTRLQTSGR